MISQDYLMKVIERLGLVLRKAKRAREEDRLDEALALVEEGYENVFGLDVQLMALMDTTTILSFLRAPEEALYLARLMAEEAELRTLAQNDKPDLTTKRALQLFAEAARETPLGAEDREWALRLLAEHPLVKLSDADFSVITTSL